MTRFALIVGSALAFAWVSTPASAHGCHAGWQQAPQNGWHSHGAKCETKSGIGVTKRSPKKAKRRVV